MKKTIILILTLSLTLGVFSSCGHKTVDPIDDQTSSSPSEDTSAESLVNDATESNQANKSEHTDTDGRLPNIDGNSNDTDVEYLNSYEIKNMGNAYYIDFNSYNIDPNDSFYVHSFLNFSSPRDFSESLINHKLSYDDMVYISMNFYRTENGIPIFDPYNFCVPLMPEKWSLTAKNCLHISDGMNFLFYIIREDDESTLSGSVRVLNKNLFEEIFNAETADFEIISNDKKQVYMYSTLNSNGTYAITMHVIENDLYYIYKIGGLDEIPSDEYLLSFGLQKYEG